MIVPFDHCYFGRPGAPCLKYLAHTNKFGYKTIEVPVGINAFILNSPKAELYVGLTALAAFTIQSYYKAYIPGLVLGSGKLRHHEFNLFSKSLHGSFGAGYKINEQLKINFELFYRLVYRQRADPVLFESNSKWIRNDFNNYGLLVGIFYKIKV